MATNFPTSLDSLTNPATSDQLSSPSHAEQHTNANDAIEQLQAKVGVNSSAVTTSHDYKIAQLEAAITAGSAGTKLIYQDVRNQSGVSLTKGTPVRVTGSDGASGKLLIGSASNASEAGSSKTFGLVSSTIANNSNGQVVTNGLLEGVDTTGSVDGDPVWLGVNGAKIFGLVNKPVAPAHLVYLGVVVRGGQQNTGSIFVSIQNGFEVEELHNVLITELANKNALVYDSTTQLWKNYDLSNDFVLSGDLQNSLGDYIPLSVLGEPDGVAKLDLDGNLIVPENKIIIEGATADAHELTLQAPDVTSDITVTLPNASGTLALTTQLFSGSYIDLTNKPNIALGAPQWTANHTLLANGENTRYLIGDIVYDGGNIYVANFENESIPTSSTLYWTSLGSGKRLNIDGRDIPNITYDQLNGKPTIPSLTGYATESYVSTAISNLVDTAPTTLDTLNELAAALGDDPNYATTITTALGNKVSKAGGDTITASSASVKPLVIKAAASQTANLMEFQNSSGTAITFFNASGGLTATEGVISTTYSGGKMTTGTLGYFNATTFNAAVSPVVVRGAASQTADLTQWQNSAGVVLATVSNGGTIKSGAFASPTDLGAYINFNSTSGAMLVGTRAAANVGIIVKGEASQTANLQEWQNSAGTALAELAINTTGGSNNATLKLLGTYGGIVSNGEWFIQREGGNLNITSPNGTLMRTVYGGTTLSLRSQPSQTADLQQWQNSSGTVLAKVDLNGAMFTITPAANTNTTQVATTAYVQTELADLVNSAPATLDTLNELATALGNDANFSTTVTNSIALKAPLASPALTGTPTAPTATAGTNTTQLATTAFVKTEITSSVQPGAVYQTSAPSSPAVGQIWIDSDQDVTTFDSNIIRRKSITATAGQTVFTTDLPFIDGFEQVFFNGLLLLKTSDYTTSGGNTVTLTSAAAVSDIVEIVSVTGANSVTTYTQAETDALLAANTSVAPLSISANTTLVAKKRYFVTSASALTLTLPATPALNDEIQILDASGNASTYNITVARNGNKINGGTGNLIIDMNGAWTTLLYTGSTYGWKVG